MKLVSRLKPGEKVKGRGTVLEVQDFANRIIVLFEGGDRKQYGVYEEVEVED
jgi:hypothetical protein